MTVAIIGESCVGKSTFAQMLKDRLNAEIYTGKDYLRLAKNEEEAKKIFSDKLSDKEQNTVYVISEKEHIELLTQNAVRVLMTADIALIKERFAKRTGGKLPPPVEQMLERKHGCFDSIDADVHIISGETEIESACEQIEALCAK